MTHASIRSLAAVIGATAMLVGLLGAATAHAQQGGSKASGKPAATASAPRLELFGLPLKGASRAQLRTSLRKGGMRSTREDDNHWVDVYDASAVLDGASEFVAGYVFATGEFAYAQYRFDGFMDTALVTKVADMVIHKYGQPAKREGNASLGNVKYQWNLAEGMRIDVTRGWPDTTTYLRYSDRKAFAAMLAAQEENRKQTDAEKARAQSHAF